MKAAENIRTVEHSMALEDQAGCGTVKLIKETSTSTRKISSRRNRHTPRMIFAIP
jgi:hypothetical protein